MRKILYILLVIFTFSLVACAQENVENPNPTLGGEETPAPTQPKEEETESLDLSNVKFADAYFLCNGNTYSIYVTGLPSELMVFYTGNDVSSLGTHLVNAKIYDFTGELVLELNAYIHIVNELPEVQLPLV